MNLLIFVIVIFFLIFILLIADYIKNIHKFELLIEKLFRNFLRIEKTAVDFAKNFFNTLSNEIRSIFYAKTCLFFVVTKEHFTLKAAACIDTTIQSDLNFDNNKDFIINKVSALKKFSPQRLKKEISARIFKTRNLTFLLPLYHNKKLTAFFILSQKNLFLYLRAMVFLAMVYKKLNEVLYDLINVVKDREQNIGTMMLLGIKDYAFITVDNDLNIATWNKGAEIMFGYDTTTGIHKTLTDLIEKESLPSFYKAVEISEKTEEVKAEIIMKDCNDTNIISEILIKRILQEIVCSGYYILIKDITKEEIWKKSIRRQAIINKSIVENARDGILLLNEESRITFLNEKVKNIVDAGITYLGMEITHIFSREYGEKFKAKIDELKNSEAELAFLNLKFGDLWYNIRFFPIKGIKTYDGIVIFFIDNTYIMKTREKLEEMNRNLIEDLQAAKLMHLNLIPSSLPQNKKIKFQAIFLPSDEVGGDFYYVDEMEIKKKKYYITLMADVSGHGLGASMLTVLVKDVYSDFKNRLEFENSLKLSDFITMLNKKIINLNMEGSKFVTIFILLIDVENKKIKYSSAGHPHAVILRGNEAIETFGIKNSPPVGIIDDFGYSEEERDILPKDKLCIYSDGILDVFSYEARNFNRFLTKNRDLDIKKMRQEIEKTIEKRKIERYENDKGKSIRIDDITLVLVELL